MHCLLFYFLDFKIIYRLLKTSTSLTLFFWQSIICFNWIFQPKSFSETWPSQCVSVCVGGVCKDLFCLHFQSRWSLKWGVGDRDGRKQVTFAAKATLKAQNWLPLNTECVHYIIRAVIKLRWLPNLYHCCQTFNLFLFS